MRKTPERLCSKTAAQGEAEESFFYFYSAVKGNYLFLNVTAEKTVQSTFSYDSLGINLLWKVIGREKCTLTHTHCSRPTQYSHKPAARGHTHTHMYMLTHTPGCVQYSVLLPWMTAGWISQKSWICSNSLKGFIFLPWQNNSFFFSPPFDGTQPHTVYSVRQNAFGSQRSVWNGFGQCNKWKSVGRGPERNRKRHTRSIFSSVQKPAGFPVDLFLSLEVKSGGHSGSKC